MYCCVLLWLYTTGTSISILVLGSAVNLLRFTLLTPRSTVNTGLVLHVLLLFRWLFPFFFLYLFLLLFLFLFLLFFFFSFLFFCYCSCSSSCCCCCCCCHRFAIGLLCFSNPILASLAFALHTLTRITFLNAAFPKTFQYGLFQKPYFTDML